MSNLTIKGKLAYGIVMANIVYKDFELQLMSVRGEIQAQSLIAAEFPDIDNYDEIYQNVIIRAAYLSQMLVKIGNVDDINVIDINAIDYEMILNLVPEDFAILSDAEMQLRKKRLGSIPQN